MLWEEAQSSPQKDYTLLYDSSVLMLKTKMRIKISLISIIQLIQPTVDRGDLRRVCVWVTHTPEGWEQ